MRKLLVGVVLLGVVVSAMPLFAQTKDPGIKRRERRQQHRIVQGVRKGQLTPREAVRVERGQRRIHRTERHMKQSGGRLSLRERGRLHRMQNRQSRQIHRLRHNERTR